MAKSRSIVRTVRAPAPVIRIAAPRSAPVQRRHKRRRGGGSRGRSKLGLFDLGMAAFALKMGIEALGDKIPVLLAQAGPEGTVALVAHFAKADRYVKGFEEVSATIAVWNFLKGTGGGGGIHFG